MDKTRRTGYRHIRQGLLYHEKEKLSMVTIGFKRGSDIDDRTVLKKLFTWMKRDFDVRVDYIRVRVSENTDFTDKRWEKICEEERWRTHNHLLWNAPYVKQYKLLEKLELYAGENCHVFIKLVQDNLKASRYMMQYLGNQGGDVSFYMSRNWLPSGCDKEWKNIKKDYYCAVPFSKLHSSDGVLTMISKNDSTWRNAVIKSMDAWIIEQRDADIQEVIS
jgi:hypothetical protein